MAISNRHITLGVNISSTSSGCTRLTNLNIFHPIYQYQTPNLLYEPKSKTSIFFKDKGFYEPYGGFATQLSPEKMIITNITFGDNFAEETWELELNEAVLSWKISRIYMIDASITDDRFPSIGLYSTVGSGATAATISNKLDAREIPMLSTFQDSVQMPSFISLDDLLDPNTHLAYTLPGDKWRALISSQRLCSDHERILLSPSGMEMNMSTVVSSSFASNRGCKFSFSRPDSVIVQTLALATQCAVLSDYQVAAGDSTTSTLTLSFNVAKNGHGNFQLDGLSNPKVQDFISEYAKIFNMFMGFIYGNSPACETCIHEASLFSQLQGLYGIDGIGGAPSVHQAMKKFLGFLYDEMVDDKGQVASRWAMNVGKDSNMPGIVDQFPHIILAAYYYAVNTNDSDAVRSWMPVLDRVMDFQLNNMLMGSYPYVLTNTDPACNGVANFSCADNWNDDIRFGWEDAIVAAYGFKSVQALAEMKEWLGLDATRLRTLEPLIKRGYSAVFWDEEHEQFSDWVDVNGNRRNYFYLWQNYAAIEFGLADDHQAQKIMTRAEHLYALEADRFNVTLEDMWCAPTNLIPARVEDITVNWEGEYVYPNYENGDCFFWMNGLEVMARGRVMGPDAGYQRFMQGLPVFENTRFWGQRYKWLEKEPYGIDVITDGLYNVYAVVFASFNIRPTLMGIEILGPPAASFEGASFTFAHLGDDITIYIKDGKQLVNQK